MSKWGKFCVKIWSIMHEMLQICNHAASAINNSLSKVMDSDSHIHWVKKCKYAVCVDMTSVEAELLPVFITSCPWIRPLLGCFGLPPTIWTTSPSGSGGRFVFPTHTQNLQDSSAALAVCLFRRGEELRPHAEAMTWRWSDGGHQNGVVDRAALFQHQVNHDAV